MLRWCRHHNYWLILLIWWRNKDRTLTILHKLYLRFFSIIFHNSLNNYPPLLDWGHCRRTSCLPAGTTHIFINFFQFLFYFFDILPQKKIFFLRFSFRFLYPIIIFILNFFRFFTNFCLLYVFLCTRIVNVVADLVDLG